MNHYHLYFLEGTIDCVKCPRRSGVVSHCQTAPLLCLPQGIHACCFERFLES